MMGIIHKLKKLDMSSSTTLHGVYLDVFDLGVLLTGASGIGKSELALNLINRGHRLIADDAVEFIKRTPEQIIGYCHPMLQDFLEVRGLGPLNIRAMFSDAAISGSQKIGLIIVLRVFTNDELFSIDRLHGMYTIRDLLGCQIPEVTIPVSSGRNLATLVEAAVRNQLLKLKGYNASQDLTKRQQDLIREV